MGVATRPEKPQDKSPGLGIKRLTLKHEAPRGLGLPGMPEKEGVCCCNNLRQTASRNHPLCAEALIRRAESSGEEFGSKAVAEAQAQATYGSPEALRVLLRLPSPDAEELFQKLVHNGDIKCIKVALYAGLAIDKTSSLDALMSVGTIELYALARELGYPMWDGIRMLFPDKYAALQELLENYNRSACPQSEHTHLKGAPKMGTLVHVAMEEAKAKKARESGGAVSEGKVQTAGPMVE